MPKNRILRQRANEPARDKARREAKKLQRKYGTAGHEFEEFAETAIENGMDPLEVAENMADFKAYQREMENIVDPNKVIFNYFSGNKSPFEPGELQARAKMSKQLVNMHEAQMKQTDAEFQRDDHKIPLFYTDEGVDVHICYHIATLLRCPFRKMMEYNLNMMQDVIYMTTYDDLEFQLNGRLQADDPQLPKVTKIVMNTQNVRIIPLTRDLFHSFAGHVGTMLHVGSPDHRYMFDKILSAIFFVRNGPISESFSIKIYVWAANKNSRKLLRRSCSGCGKTRVNEKFLCCSECKRVYYCSDECGKRHWVAHKQICQEIGHELQDI